jgi:hypothetical protein
MGISWWQLIKAAPEANKAVKLIGTKDWLASQSILYQIIKAGVTVLMACGLAVVMSEQEIQTISTGLAIVIPAVCTLFDAAAAIWLRLRTSQPITGTVQAAKVEAATAAKVDGIVEETETRVREQG